MLGEHGCCLSDICDETKIESNIIHSPNMDNREKDHRICGIIKGDKDTMMFQKWKGSSIYYLHLEEVYRTLMYFL